MSNLWLMGLLSTVPISELQKAHDRRDYMKLAVMLGGKIVFHSNMTEAKFKYPEAAEAFNNALRPMSFPGSKLLSFPGENGTSIFWYHELQTPKRTLEERFEIRELETMTMHDKVVPPERLRTLTNRSGHPI